MEIGLYCITSLVTEYCEFLMGLKKLRRITSTNLEFMLDSLKIYFLFVDMEQLENCRVTLEQLLVCLSLKENEVGRFVSLALKIITSRYIKQGQLLPSYTLCL